VSTPATKEISDWLEKLGMSEQAQRFAFVIIALVGHLRHGEHVARMPKRRQQIRRADADDAVECHPTILRTLLDLQLAPPCSR
jgi:hypothetical protein